MSDNPRLMKGSPREIGLNEVRSYSISVPTDWGVPTTPITVEVFDKSGVNISTAVSGTPGVSGQNVSFGLKGASLQKGQAYEVRATFALTDGQTRSVVGEWRVRV